MAHRGGGCARPRRGSARRHGHRHARAPVRRRRRRQRRLHRHHPPPVLLLQQLFILAVLVQGTAGLDAPRLDHAQRGRAAAPNVPPRAARRRRRRRRRHAARGAACTRHEQTATSPAERARRRGVRVAGRPAPAHAPAHGRPTPARPPAHPPATRGHSPRPTTPAAALAPLPPPRHPRRPAPTNDQTDCACLASGPPSGGSDGPSGSQPPTLLGDGDAAHPPRRRR